MPKRKNNNDSPEDTRRSKQSRGQKIERSQEAMEVEEAPTTSSGSVRSLNCETRSGKILAIKLKNFMCHRNLTVDFNQRTNLIVGRNGSGKSAILTALIIGLGAKANATDRSSNIKQLIRRGENSCTIEVHLSNDGDDQYEREKYGDRIIVSRHVSSSGGSTYKMKSQWGHVISTSRTELLRMILYMNIQVDNPVCVLTQDASRGFLRDSNPAKRFELFLRATQMDVILHSVETCHKESLKFREELKYHEKLAEENKKEMEKAKEKFAQFQSMEVMKTEIKNLKNQAQWHTVVDQELFIAEIQKTYDDSMQKKEKFMAAINNSESGQQELRDKLEAMKLEFTNNARDVVNFDTKFDEARNNYKAKNDVYLQKLRDMKRVESRRVQIETDLTNLQEHFAERSKTSQSEIQQMRKRNEDALAEHRQKKQEMTAMQTGTKRDYEMFTNTKEELQRQLHTLADKHKYKKGEIAHLESQQKIMSRDQQSTLRLFGEYMPRLVAEIEQLYKHGKFTEMPLGPIGAFVEVNNAKYLGVVEDALKSVLHAFYVNDAKDRVVLNELFRKYPGARATVITSRFMKRTYDVSEKCVRSDSRSHSIMDLITVSNPDVMNCLIDQVKIETILVTDNQEHAINLTSRQENVPENLFKVIVTEPYRECYPAPMYRSYTKQKYSATILQPNMAQRESYLKSELHKRLQEAEHLQTEYRTINAKSQDNEKHLAERRKRLAQLNTEIRNVEVDIKELESVEYPAEDELTLMEQELEVQSKNLEKVIQQCEEEKARCTELKVNIDEMEADIKKMRRENQEFKDSVQDKQSEMDELVQQIAKWTSTKTSSQAKLQQCELTIAKIDKELSDANEKLQRLVRTAEKFGPRVELQHSPEDIQRKIKINERKITVITNTSETMESVERRMHRTQTDYQRKIEEVNAVANSLLLLRKTTKYRSELGHKLMRYMTSNMSYTFQRIMNLRGFKGVLNIDVAKRTLEIEVVPRDKGVENATTKTNSLSGGERSYSTVALLISLWSCVDNPFYFLDEYDVFTDEVNRMYMTKLLLMEASKKVFQQYALLTPQDTPDITPSETLSILKMDDPERT